MQHGYSNLSFKLNLFYIFYLTSFFDYVFQDMKHAMKL